MSHVSPGSSAFHIPPRYDHTDSLLARAAARGPIRKTAETAWSAMMSDPRRAGFQLTHHLRKARRSLRSWERRLLAAGLYALVRSHRLLGSVIGCADDAADLWIAWLVHQGLPRTDGSRHTGLDLAPAAELETAAPALLAGRPAAERLAIGHSVPDDLADTLLAELGEQAFDFMAASNQRAPLVLRVNREHATRRQILERLADDEVAAEPHPLVDSAIALSTRMDVRQTDLFREGLIEIQDAGSQMLVDFALDGGGGRILDYCAGAGGKTLALLATASNAASGLAGSVWAWDVANRKLERLPPRAARARHSAPLRLGLPPEQSMDLVLVDAPCSGSGTLRRDPCLRWRLLGARAERMQEAQRDALNKAASYVKPGGRLVYATCSVFSIENDAVVDEFSAASAEFQATGRELRLRPDTHNTDGFYASELTRASS